MPELLLKEFDEREYSKIVNIILKDYKTNKENIINTFHRYYSLEQAVKRHREVYLNILKVCI